MEQDKKSQRIELDILWQLKGWAKKEATFLGQTDKWGRGLQKEQRIGGTETDRRKKQTGG